MLLQCSEALRPLTRPDTYSAAFNQMDEDGDGEVTFEEFQKFAVEFACGAGQEVRVASYFTLLYPFIHLYSRTYTYIHPLYMYIHHMHT